MEPDIRLVARIYRAIRDLSSDAPIDEAKCRRIASLIQQSESSTTLEALVEQHAERIQEMEAEEFVAYLRSRAADQHASGRAGRAKSEIV